MKAFADLADLPEDDRIAIIAESAKTHIVGFVVDDHPKADRYCEKLAKYPAIRVIDRADGPTTGAVIVRVGPKGN